MNLKENKIKLIEKLRHVLHPFASCYWIGNASIILWQRDDFRPFVDSSRCRIREVIQSHYFELCNISTSYSIEEGTRLVLNVKPMYCDNYALSVLILNHNQKTQQHESSKPN